MKTENQRIAIAGLCGWDKSPIKYMSQLPWGCCAGKPHWFYIWELPDYLNDLNAMYEVEEALDKVGQELYLSWLCRLTSYQHKTWPLVHATAAQRAEALLRAKGLWEGAPLNMVKEKNEAERDLEDYLRRKGYKSERL